METLQKAFTLCAMILCLLMLPLGGAALAHCEIPCGIYDDGLRVKLIAEHAGTIEKSMAQIKALEGETPVNFNQLVRWVANKDQHADEIQHIVSQYFLTQRIKPDQPKYGEKLALLHQMLVSAMKCKQTVDSAHVGKLRELLGKFETLYFEK
jgi:nickel superoxide dismutase